MKKKGTGSLFLAVIIIAVLVYLLMDRGPFGGDDTSFSVRENTVISRIDLLQGKDRLSLQKIGDDWVVNKTLQARKSAVLSLLRTLETMEIKSTVTPQTFRDEIIDMNIDPVRVTVYEKRRVVKSFFVYKTQSNIYGNIMKMKPNSKPYIVFKPGYEDNIGVLFSMKELFWQPLAVFNSLPSQIESVEFEDLLHAESSFEIEKSDGILSLADSSGLMYGWDSLKVRRYLSYFTSIQLESWAFELREDSIGSIINRGPAYRISLTNVDGERRTLTVWERWNYEEGEKIMDSDRLWGKTDDADLLFVIRYFDLDPILKRKSYFFGD